MKPPSRGRGKTPKQRPSSVKEGADWLRAYAVQMYDQGDGTGVDWPVVAQATFTAAFSILKEAQGDGRAMKVLRQVEARVYDGLALNPDDGLPPALHTSGEAPAPQPLAPHQTPGPRNRP